MPGSLVVLAACEVGRATARPGGEVLGLASVLLRLGAGAVVAPLAPLRDEVAADVMPRLHARVREGLDPASALTAACSGLDEPVALACFGPLARGARTGPYRTEPDRTLPVAFAVGRPGARREDGGG